MHRAERVCKARMFSRLVCKMSQAELFYSAKALKFRRIDQTSEKLSFVVAGLNADDVMNRIAVYFFGQIFAPKGALI
jgi:Iap family predicted aminopeptidase